MSNDNFNKMIYVMEIKIFNDNLIFLMIIYVRGMI